MGDNKIIKKRNNLIYGNCKVYSNDNILMFLCIDKKALWYVNKNLAEIISENPLSIRLKFEPNGKGHEGDEYYLGLKKNICCVCGEDNIEKLSKHHIIPSEFRKLLPLGIKSHSSHDVVPICNDCHTKYESKYVVDFKIHIGSICGINYYEMLSDYISEIKNVKMINNLIINIDRINDVGKDNMLKKIKKFSNNYDITFNDLYYQKENLVINKFNTHVIDYFLKNNSLQYFHELWREHFCNNMNPKYMPDAWSITRKFDKIN